MIPYRAGTVRITSPYGMRTLNGVRGMHTGVDLVGTDKNIVAVTGGKVIRSRMVPKSAGNSTDRTWEWGNYICIRDDAGRCHYYCHLSKRLVEAGDTVVQGQCIGVEGSTGYSTGSHLHYELRNPSGVSVDPTPSLAIPNRVTTLNAEQHYYGTLVSAKCGFEAKTRAYLDEYRFAPDLWRKLWQAMV